MPALDRAEHGGVYELQATTLVEEAQDDPRPPAPSRKPRSMRFVPGMKMSGPLSGSCKKRAVTSW
jgi:hypothetical protein